MRKVFLFLSMLLGTSATADDTAPQLGLNFMRYFWDRPGDFGEPTDTINADVQRLGADAMRQLVRADLVWRDVEPRDDQWDFSRSDVVLSAPSATPIVTLFSLQYASPTPPWVQGPGAFQPVLGPAARDYVETVVKRYADKVRYWEIGNEMDHWRISDPGDRRRPPAKRPPHSPPGGFSPEAQGRFVAATAAIIREHDPDAVILMPGMGGLSPYVIDTWLPGFLKGAGSDGFDVVGYHFYGSWNVLKQRRERLGKALSALGIADKPVWLTETGSTSVSDLTLRTDYPNSEASQAADVFRRAAVAWGAGDQAVFWHTLQGSPERPRNRWRGYGLKAADGRPKLAHSSYGLLGAHLSSHQSVKPVSGLSRGQYGYEIVRRDGAHRWVFWGEGTVPAPTKEPAKAYTSVVPGQDGRYAWRGVGDELVLSEIPVLLRN